MESAKRGYIATGDENFLRPYLEGTKRIDPEFQALLLTVDDNPSQQQRLKQVYSGYQESEKYDTGVIALRRSGKADPSLIANQQRQYKMDPLRDQIAEFQSIEEGLRTERVHAARLRWVLMMGSFLGLGLGVGVILTLFTRYSVEKLSTKLLQSEERWTTTLGCSVVASRWALRWGKRGPVPRILAINNDIAERKRNEKPLVLRQEQLKALAEHLQLAREEDRKQIVYDLHEQIGQILAAVKNGYDLDGPSSAGVGGAGACSTHGIDSVNQRRRQSGTHYLQRVTPGVLDDLGLATAIECQASEFASRNGVLCQVNVPPVDLPLDGDRATATFRIFQECMTNVIRHAQAKSIRIDLSQEEKNILLVVEDDGIGFHESEFSNAFGSLGLLGMKERAQFCGRDMHISSSSGKGTTVTIRVPVDIPRRGTAVYTS